VVEQRLAGTWQPGIKGIEVFLFHLDDEDKVRTRVGVTDRVQGGEVVEQRLREHGREGHVVDPECKGHPHRPEQQHVEVHQLGAGAAPNPAMAPRQKASGPPAGARAPACRCPRTPRAPTAASSRRGGRGAARTRPPRPTPRSPTPPPALRRDASKWSWQQGTNRTKFQSVLRCSERHSHARASTRPGSVASDLSLSHVYYSTAQTSAV